MTFREVAYEYLHWLAHVREAKPSTLVTIAICSSSRERRIVAGPARMAARS